VAPLSIASALKLTRTGLQDVFIDVSPNKGAIDHDLPMEAWRYQDPSKTMLRRMLMYQDRSGIIKIYQDKFGISTNIKKTIRIIPSHLGSAALGVAGVPGAPLEQSRLVVGAALARWAAGLGLQQSDEAQDVHSVP
jgi:hypothetical protein